MRVRADGVDRKGKEPAQQEGLIKEMRKPKRKNLSETDGGLLTPAAVGMPAAAGPTVDCRCWRSHDSLQYELAPVIRHAHCG